MGRNISDAVCLIMGLFKFIANWKVADKWMDKWALEYAYWQNFLNDLLNDIWLNFSQK